MHEILFLYIQICAGTVGSPGQFPHILRKHAEINRNTNNKVNFRIPWLTILPPLFNDSPCLGLALLAEAQPLINMSGINLTVTLKT